ncbi:hypothetical protein LIA77_08558 [Sarocladium implicatum]|nr:hypothetical protein LIA77_08558 [Sarocladium implicatum]
MARARDPYNNDDNDNDNAIVRCLPDRLVSTRCLGHNDEADDESLFVFLAHFTDTFDLELEPHPLPTFPSFEPRSQAQHDYFTTSRPARIPLVFLFFVLALNYWVLSPTTARRSVMDDVMGVRWIALLSPQWKLCTDRRAAGRPGRRGCEACNRKLIDRKSECRDPSWSPSLPRSVVSSLSPPDGLSLSLSLPPRLTSTSTSSPNHGGSLVLCMCQSWNMPTGTLQILVSSTSSKVRKDSGRRYQRLVSPHPESHTSNHIIMILSRVQYNRQVPSSIHI